MKDETAVMSFPVVGIGFPENGTEVLVELLEQMDGESGMAFIMASGSGEDNVSGHLLPVVKGIEVQTLTNGVSLQPDCFYYIPKGKAISFDGNKVELEPAPDKKTVNPINELFTSLANAQGENTIGVLLPDSGSDGFDGLKAIREANGLSLIALMEMTGHNGVKPEAAADAADISLPLRAIATEISKLGRHIRSLKKLSARKPETETSLIQDIFRLLKKNSGLDFNHYKPASINRRIKRRMLLLKITSLEKYSKYLSENPLEVESLHQDILINVTRFFRDPDAFLYLKEELFPFLLNKSAEEPLRIWVPACSTGQEAFSIAIALHSILETEHPKYQVNIFATDISKKAIDKARLGVYSKSEVAGIDEETLERYFEKTEDSYRVNKNIRDCCIFATHNLLKDPPFSRIDFISCCNLFIYLDTKHQKQAVNTFHYSLNNGGFLLLGSSETIGSQGRFFRQTETNYKVNIYRRDISVRQSLQSYGKLEKQPKSLFIPKLPLAQPKAEDLHQNVKDLLLSKYVIPSVVINQSFEILQFHGSTDLFIDPAPGHATFNLLKMARANLRIDIRNAVHKAIKNNTIVKKKGLETSIRDMHFNIDLEVVPIEAVNGIKNFLILFRDYPKRESLTEVTEVNRFQQELESIKEDMSYVIDELETANEVLQLMNEEVVSSNEELQALNEELQTSREEIEASNEELSSVNEQLRLVNEQLRETMDYTDGIIDTISEAVIVVNKCLVVKSVNSSFYKIFGGRKRETEGNKLFEIGNAQFAIPACRI